MVVDGAHRVGRRGPGAATRRATYVDGTGCLATPGFVNTHHHLYQWLTRGMAADDTLFDWLTALYPVWAGLDEDTGQVGATGALVQLARTGCTTTTDHHYVFPAGGGDLLGARSRRRAPSACASCRPAARWTSAGAGAGAADQVVEEIDAILAATADAIDRTTTPPPTRCCVGVAPCSPFSVTGDLLEQAAALARDKGVRLHTSPRPRTRTPSAGRSSAAARSSTSSRWAGSARTCGSGPGSTSTTRASPRWPPAAPASRTPSSNARLGGICRTRDLRTRRRSASASTGPRPTRRRRWSRVRHSVLFARAVGGPQALTVRAALELATIGGARVLGWDDQIGSLEAGMADLALWRVDTAAHAGIEDPVAALVLARRLPELLLVQGRPVVRHDAMVDVDEERLAVDVRARRR